MRWVVKVFTRSAKYRSVAPTAGSVAAPPMHSMMSSGWALPECRATAGNPVGRAAATTDAPKITTSRPIATTADNVRSRAARRYSGNRVSRPTLANRRRLPTLFRPSAAAAPPRYRSPNRHSRRSPPPTTSAPRSDQLLGRVARGPDVRARVGVELRVDQLAQHRCGRAQFAGGDGVHLHVLGANAGRRDAETPAVRG